MSSYELDQILKNHSIIEYLKTKGFYPSKQSVNKYSYKCPLPDHQNDIMPSFFVYDKGDRQDFHCFGCKKSGNIINLHHLMENISIKNSIKYLSQGLNIKIDDVINHIVNEINSSLNKEDFTINDDLWHYMMSLSCMTYDFLYKVNKHEEYFKKCEKMYEHVDSMARTNDIKSIEEVKEKIPDMLQHEIIKYNENVFRQEIELVESRIKNEF